MKHVCILSVLIGFNCECLGSVITVGVDGKSDFGTIQAAIDASMNGDEIIINSGIYNESLNTLGKSIWVHAVTDADVTIEALPDARHLTINSGESSDTIIEGIIFDGLTVSGGLAMSGSSPTILDCEIRYCDWINGGGSRVDGGSPTIIACLFFENHGTGSGTYGGGAAMNIRGGANVSMDNSVVVTDDTYNNQTNGIMVEGGSSVQLTNCSFSGPAVEGGCCGTFGSFIYHAPGVGSVTATGCTFSGGAAGSQLFGWRGFDLYDCTFSGHWGNGAAINLNYGTMNITNCVFEDNIPGCIDVYYSANIFIEDTLFCGSSEYDIGAPWNDLGGNEFLTECESPVLGACCINGEAVELFDNDCERILGEFMGEGSDPDQVICSSYCPSDVDGDGEVGVSDILIIITAWGTCQ